MTKLEAAILFGHIDAIAKANRNDHIGELARKYLAAEQALIDFYGKTNKDTQE